MSHMSVALESGDCDRAQGTNRPVIQEGAKRALDLGMTNLNYIAHQLGGGDITGPRHSMVGCVEPVRRRRTLPCKGPFMGLLPGAQKLTMCNRFKGKHTDIQTCQILFSPVRMGSGKAMIAGAWWRHQPV